VEIIEIDPPAVSKELKKRWYDTDPLTCPKCRGETAIISFIDQPEVIKKNPSTLRSVGRSSSPAGQNRSRDDP